MNERSKLERRLKVACEISANHVVAARATERNDALENFAVRSLADGAVVPDLTNVNVANRGAVVTALSEALASVGTNHRDLIAVIPDATCRVALLDFDTLPPKPQEADSVVRFRLKKSLPFEIEKARLSYDVRQNNGVMRVTAVVALPGVIEEYEAVFHEAGFSPGFVVPSTLASFGIVDTSRPTLVINVAIDATSIAIVNNDELLLYRRIENSPEGIYPDQLAEEVYPSFVFFQDTYGLKIERILVGGGASFEALSGPLESGTGVRPQELVPQHALSSVSIGSAQRPYVAGVMGALIS